MCAQLLEIEIHAGVFLRVWGTALAGWGLGDGEGESATPGDVHDSESGKRQPAFRARGAAVEEVPKTERLLPTLRDEGGILRRDHFRLWGERRLYHVLMKGRPVKGASKLPRYRALGVGTIAAQIAKVDAPSQGQDGAEQHSKEPALRLTDPRHPL
jgi:hypothetical protein